MGWILIILYGLQEWILTILYGLQAWIVQAFRDSSSGSTSELDDGEKEVDRILSNLSGLQRRIQNDVGSSSLSTSDHVSLPALKRINDYVHEIFISKRRPSVEIVFFHGLQFDSTKDPRIATWLSRDKSKLWLVWLLEEIPDARILVVTYDVCARTTVDQGTMDMYVTRENLVHSFTGTRAPIGQDGCPVVLVGHCVGDLVMKELCIQANSILGLKRIDEQDPRMENLLWNVKGLFFYASGFHKGPLFGDVTTLNKHGARRNEEFRKLREKYGWKTFGVVEGSETTLGRHFRGIVVPEASARSDVDEFSIIAAADHFTVCQPDSKESNNFQLLYQFVAGVLEKDKERFSTTITLSPDVVGLEARVKEMTTILEGVQRLGMCGLRQHFKEF